MDIMNSMYVVKILQFQQGQDPLCKNAGGPGLSPLPPGSYSPAIVCQHTSTVLWI